MCYFLNVHTAFGTIHYNILAFCPVEQYTQVEFFYRIRSTVINILCNEDLVYFFTSGPGLNSYQRATQDIFSYGAYIVEAFAYCNTSLLLPFNFALSPS